MFLPLQRLNLFVPEQSLYSDVRLSAEIEVSIHFTVTNPN